MKAKLFLDTNVMMDLLSERLPFYNSIAKITSLADKGEIKMVASGLSYTTINYLLTKIDNVDIVLDKLRKFKIISEVALLDDEIIEKGLNSNFSDFEDAVQYFSALKANCHIIITRNTKEFKESRLPVMTPDEFLASIKKK
ncbi:PIN domain-containing protein [Dyadobacter sp. CY356]|uniref:type II toxin-antitoxin system VapC family toxin n=1 Tax=Dyadobacter sp. CY356 TaxID=2906442 RepID=UPI001F362F69|nr:PIN domain-containing protein [Dyadobacter sp. CY356]MCF0057424.1 PIN domain-containing protein [Dyadobacter sp. CY356]